MDRYVVNKSPYNNMLSRHSDKPFFTVCIPTKIKSFSDKLKDLLILMNRYYPSFTYDEGTVNGFKDYPVKWEDVILTNKRPSFNVGDRLEFNVPIYFEENGVLKKSQLKQNGIAIYFDIDHENREVLILFIRPNCFTDLNYIEYFDTDKGWCKTFVDQSKSARMNRENLANFLERIEHVLGQEITEFGASNVKKKLTYKYGFKDRAKLDNLPS